MGVKEGAKSSKVLSCRVCPILEHRRESRSKESRGNTTHRMPVAEHAHARARVRYIPQHVRTASRSSSIEASVQYLLASSSEDPDKIVRITWTCQASEAVVPKA